MSAVTGGSAPGSGSVQAPVASDAAAVLAAVEQVARTHLKWSGTLAPDAVLVEALALDSLRTLTLVVEIENRFRICFDEADEASVKTVGDLVAAIRRKRADAGPDAR
jgi:acyl carrier protein